MIWEKVSSRWMKTTIETNFKDDGEQTTITK